MIFASGTSQAHDLRVGDLDDRLPDLGEAVGLLAVDDRPRLVEAVDESAAVEDRPALFKAASHPHVAVAGGEEGLGLR
jgi:hypothetical protein